jgi:signal transduction histidine kinase
MGQVLANLLVNAAVHGAPGCPIDVSVARRDGGAVLRVHNEGNPIPEALMPTLFDPFKRGERVSRSSPGIGLGLYIVRWLVEAHDGTIDVRSSPAAGTSFSVWIPDSPPSLPP